MEEIPRLERDKRLLQFLLRQKEKEIQRLNVKAKTNLETIETYLIQKIEQVKSDCNINRFVTEMEYLLKTVKEEKSLINKPSATKWERENKDEKDISQKIEMVGKEGIKKDDA